MNLHPVLTFSLSRVLPLLQPASLLHVSPRGMSTSMKWAHGNKSLAGRWIRPGEMTDRVTVISDLKRVYIWGAHLQ